MKRNKNSRSGFSGRSLKDRIIEILGSKDLQAALGELRVVPVRRVINSLFPLLYSSDQHTKWKAISAIGLLVDRLAEEDMESARVIIRRLMWNLNDESGGIGWGSAEAMGEILANNESLAGEYSSILLSYAREDGNFQELESMQRGVLWGIGRLAQVRSEFVREGLPYLTSFLESDDAVIRGTAAWIIGSIGGADSIDDLKRLLIDESKITIFIDGRLLERRVKEIAKDALETIPH